MQVLMIVLVMFQLFCLVKKRTKMIENKKRYFRYLEELNLEMERYQK